MHPRLMQHDDDEHSTPERASLEAVSLADEPDGAVVGSVWEMRLGGEVVVRRLLRADRIWSRTRGLLGRSALASDEGLWIDPCTSIHMLGMRFAIDAVFIDAQRQVVRVVADLRPGRLARGGKFAHSVLELPQGKAAFFNVRVGDRLQLVPPHSS